MPTLKPTPIATNIPSTISQTTDEVAGVIMSSTSKVPSTSTSSSSSTTTTATSNVSSTIDVSASNIDSNSDASPESVLDDELQDDDALPWTLIGGVLGGLCCVCCFVAIVLVWLMRRRGSDENELNVRESTTFEVQSINSNQDSNYAQIQFAETTADYGNPFQSVRDDYSLDLQSVGGT